MRDRIPARHSDRRPGRSRLAAAAAPATAPAAALAAALALTLAALLAAVTERLPPQPLAPGIFFGWTAGNTGQLHVPGQPCQGAPGGSDSLVTVFLENGSRVMEFPVPTATSSSVPLDFGPEVPVVTFAPDALWTQALQLLPAPGPAVALREERLARMTVHCRSHAQASTRLGGAAYVRVPATTSVTGSVPTLSITARRVAPDSDLLGVFVLSNDSPTTVTLSSLRFAPSGTATSSLLAAAGDREHVAGWLGAVLGVVAAQRLSGTVDPATLTPWDAAFQEPDDPCGLRSRDADALDILLHPGDMAVVAVPREALHRTLVPRSALLYPVLGYVIGDGSGSDTEVVWQGLSTPLFGTTPAWL